MKRRKVFDRNIFFKHIIDPSEPNIVCLIMHLTHSTAEARYLTCWGYNMNKICIIHLLIEIKKPKVMYICMLTEKLGRYMGSAV